MYYFHHDPLQYDATYYLAATLIETNTMGELWLELSYAEDDRVARMIARNREKHELYQYLAQRADKPDAKTHVSRAHEHEHMITARLAKGYYVLTINGRNINESIDARLLVTITSGSRIDVASQFDGQTHRLTQADDIHTSIYDEHHNHDSSNTIQSITEHKHGWIFPVAVSVIVLVCVISSYMYYRYMFNKRNDYSLIDDEQTLAGELTRG